MKEIFRNFLRTLHPVNQNKMASPTCLPTIQRATPKYGSLQRTWRGYEYEYKYFIASSTTRPECKKITKDKHIVFYISHSWSLLLLWKQNRYEEVFRKFVKFLTYSLLDTKSYIDVMTGSGSGDDGRVSKISPGIFKFSTRNRRIMRLNPG